ncbi:MAG: hypothetical protein ACLP1D_12785 [Xanthobacteraceae bacterium]
MSVVDDFLIEKFAVFGFEFQNWMVIAGFLVLLHLLFNIVPQRGR